MPKDFENFAKVANVFTKSGHTDCLPVRVLKREREREREAELFLEWHCRLQE